MIGKEGRVESPAYLGWVRRQGCRVAEQHRNRLGCQGPIDPHHVDGKGMGGARCRDDRTVPLCRIHHDEAHARGALLGAWADETLRRFLDGASDQEIGCYMADLRRWRSRPLAVPF